MTDFFAAVIGFIVLMLFIGFALWFGAALLVLVFISAALLPLFLVLQGYYMRWRYKKVFNPTDPGNFTNKTTVTEHKIGDTTIIDVEYEEISGSNRKP